MDRVRCRVAPSPTGNLHVGTAHTALFNFLFARHHKGVFILRIDDSDSVRSKKEYEENIIESLKWLGIEWDEGPDVGGKYGPYRQSERMDNYKKYLNRLLEENKAYYCYCTKEELENERKLQEAKKQPTKYSGKCAHLGKEGIRQLIHEGRKPVIRFRTPNKIVKFTDLIRGEISVNSNLFGDFVIARSDGSSLLNFAATIDDIEMKITHAIRGEDFLNLVPRQIVLFESLGYPTPVFAHLSFLYAPDRTKLSKRHGATSVTEYKEMGVLSEAIVNYLSTLGWSLISGDQKAQSGNPEIFSFGEAIKSFDITKVQKSAPIFDYEKLRWMNGEYIRNKSNKDLKNLLYHHVSMLTREYDGLLDKILPLVKERMKTLNEFWSLAGFFFERPKEFVRPLKVSPLKVAREAIEKSEWNHDVMEKAIRDAADKAKLKAKDVFMELRVAVTGKTVGPPLLESLEILGREETLKRIPSNAGRFRW